MLGSGSMSQMLKKVHTLIYHLFMMSIMSNVREYPFDVAVRTVIDQYVEVIAELNIHNI